MKIDYFLNHFQSKLLNSEGDQYFSCLKLLTGGGTSPRVAKMLNFATSLLDDGECYCEVGVFRGYTLVSAGYWNGKKVVGIDNFDVKGSVDDKLEADEVKNSLLASLRAYSSNALFIESDFREVAESVLKEKIGVSFIDGKHDFQSVHDNLVWQEKFLADKALIFFDDVNLSAVDVAIKSWAIDRRDNYDIVCYIKPHYVGDIQLPADRVIHNGICIMRYDRGGIR